MYIEINAVFLFQVINYSMSIVIEISHCFRHIFRLLLNWARNIKKISWNIFNRKFYSFVWKCNEENENVNKWIKKTSVVHINIWWDIMNKFYHSRVDKLGIIKLLQCCWPHNQKPRTYSSWTYRVFRIIYSCHTIQQWIPVHCIQY